MSAEKSHFSAPVSPGLAVVRQRARYAVKNNAFVALDRARSVPDPDEAAIQTIEAFAFGTLPTPSDAVH